jgi:integrase
MPSAWVERRPSGRGTRYRVKWRAGGREDVPRAAGTFGTAREAKIRRDWVAGELAAMRMPDLRLVTASGETLAEAAGRWKTSRVDVAPGTTQTYDVALGRLLPRWGTKPLASITSADVAGLVAQLHGDGLRKQTIRKTVSVLAMVFDHAKIDPNPARDKDVEMPREEKRIVEPPTADHVAAVIRLLPTRYRLPVAVLDATGMRVGELEALTWGDMDEPRGRWRIATSKTGRPRWVTPPEGLYALVQDLCPRDDRVPERPVFTGVTGDRLRTRLTRAATAAGVPAFSPHDLRHRRVSLLHLAGVPWARIGEAVGHDDITTTSRVYTHVLADETEIEYSVLLENVPG